MLGIPSSHRHVRWTGKSVGRSLLVPNSRAVPHGPCNAKGTTSRRRKLAARFYPGRTAGGDCDHRHLDCAAAAGRAGGARVSTAHPVLEQSQTTRTGHSGARIGQTLLAHRGLGLRLDWRPRPRNRHPSTRRLAVLHSPLYRRELAGPDRSWTRRRRSQHQLAEGRGDGASHYDPDCPGIMCPSRRQYQLYPANGSGETNVGYAPNVIHTDYACNAGDNTVADATQTGQPSSFARWRRQLWANYPVSNGTCLPHAELKLRQYFRRPVENLSHRRKVFAARDVHDRQRWRRQ